MKGPQTWTLFMSTSTLLLSPDISIYFGLFHNAERIGIKRKELFPVLCVYITNAIFFLLSIHTPRRCRRLWIHIFHSFFFFCFFSCVEDLIKYMKLACVRRHYPQWLASFFFFPPARSTSKTGTLSGGVEERKREKKKRERERRVFTRLIY